MNDKTLGNVGPASAKQNVPDIVTFGDPGSWQCICKASSQAEGWMKSTKAMNLKGLGCLVQVTTQQRNPDGSYSVAEAVCFVPFGRVKKPEGCEVAHSRPECFKGRFKDFL